MDQFRARSDAHTLLRLVPQFANHPGYRRIVWPSPFPTNYRDFATSGSGHYTAFDKEVAWTASALALYEDRLKAFICLRRRFERALFSGDVTDAESTLSTVEEQFGMSVWLAESRIGLTAQRYGFKEQRAYSQAITEQTEVPGYVRYLISWMSFRAEENVSSEEFARLLGLMMPLKHGFSHLIQMKLGLTPSINSDIAAQILSQADTFPLVDRYLAFVDVLSLYCASGNVDEQDRSIAINILSVLSKEFGDERLNRILISYGGKLGSVQYADVDAYDSYTSGSYGEAAELASASVEAHADVDAMNISLHSEMYLGTAQQAPDQSSLRGTIEAGLRDVARRTSDALTTLKRLEKLSLVYGATAWGSTVGLLLEKLAADDRISEPSVRQTYFALRGTADHPFLAFSLPSKSRVSYLSTRFSPTSITAALALATITGNFEEGLSAVPLHRRQRYEAISCLRQRNFSDAIALLRSLAAQSDERARWDVDTCLNHALLAIGEVGEAADITASLTLLSTFFATVLPVGSLVDAIVREQDAEGWGSSSRGKLSTAIVFDVYARFVSSDREAERADAYKDFLKAQGVDRASALASRISEYPRDSIVYFLERVCAPEVLDQSLAFTSTREVEDERVAILVLLTEIIVPDGKSPLRPHLEELREIRTRQVVRDTTRQLDQSKVYVNVEGIRREVSISVKENWQRYRLLAMQDSVADEMSELQQKIKTLLGDSISVVSLELPITERNKLFTRIIRNLRDQFTLSREFGLDANLSTNIRHGYVLRELRGPFVTRNLVTNREDDDSPYKDSDYWTQRYDENDSSVTGAMDALRQFSESVDRIIDQVNRDILRINSDASPFGLFNYNISDPALQLMQQRCDSFETHDELLDYVFDFLWARTEENLAAVREELLNSISQALISAVTILHDAVELTEPSEARSELIAATLMVRPELTAAVERVASWFKISANDEYADFDVRIAYEAGIETVRSYYSDTAIEAVYTHDEPLLLKGFALPIFARLFVLLLDNAAQHSGLRGKRLGLEVSVTLTDGVLYLECINRLGENIDLARLKDRIGQLRDNYGKDESAEFVSREGGSGYHKIWKLLRHDLRRDHDVEVDLTDDDSFRTRFVIDPRGILA